MQTVHHLQIERVIQRGPENCRAEFLKDGVLLVSAGFWKARKHAQIYGPVGPMDIESASATAVALQMAIDWVTEEIEALPLCPDSPDGNHHVAEIGSDEEWLPSKAPCYYCGDKQAL